MGGQKQGAVFQIEEGETTKKSELSLREDTERERGRLKRRRGEERDKRGAVRLPLAAASCPDCASLRSTEFLAGVLAE